MVSFLEYYLSVDEDVFDTFVILEWVFVCGAIHNARGIKDRDVRSETG